jgi:hypothetical protein
MSINRNFTWTNDTIEHTEQDEQRAQALARRWSALQTDIENEHFERQARYEDGWDYEPPECPTCDSRGVVGLDNPEHWRASTVALASCLRCGGAIDELIGITCPDCDGNGYDKSGERARAAFNADRALEIELLEDKLHAMGARMMRPYEHWNEEERLMEYLERER